MESGKDIRRFAPSEAASWTDTGGDLVVFDRSQGGYHALNGTASAIWRALGTGQSRGAVVEVVLQCFEGDRSTITAEVEAFLWSALAGGLIVEIT